MEASLGDGAFNRGTNSFYIRAKDILDTRGARMFHRGDNAHGFLSARTLEHSVHLGLPPPRHSFFHPVDSLPTILPDLG